MQSFKLLIILFIAALPLQHSAAFEAIGEITVNGEIIRPVLFEGYQQHNMTDNQTCPPLSDSYLKDQIIRRALVVFDARKRSLPIRESSKKWMQKQSDELARQGPNGNKKAINKAEALLFEYEYSGYLNHYAVEVSHEEILAEYKRLIELKDPRFTDVVIVRRTRLEFNSIEDTDKAEELLRNGSTLNEVADAITDEHFHSHLSSQWAPAYGISGYLGYSGDGRDLETGSVLRTADHGLLYFNEVKFRPRLRPFTKYRNSKDYVYKEVRLDLLKVGQRARDLAMWNSAEVLENGLPLKMSNHYPSCL